MPKSDFTYSPGKDGCDETFDISYPDGKHLVSIHFWERRELSEAEALLIVKALRRYTKTNAGKADLKHCMQLAHQAFVDDNCLDDGLDDATLKAVFAATSQGHFEAEEGTQEPFKDTGRAT